MHILLYCLVLLAADEKAVDEHFPLSLTGQAIDSDGQPIDGATVFLVSNKPDRMLGRITTGADGRYEFRDMPLPVRMLRDKKPIFASHFQLFGQSPGYAFAWQGTKWICFDLSLPGLPRPEDIREQSYSPSERIKLDLTFVKPRSITGRFVDEQGRPIERVHIRLASCDYLDTKGHVTHKNFREFWSLNQAGLLMPDQVRATTGKDGRFELPAVPPGVLCWLRAEHSDFGHRFFYTATSDRPIEQHNGRSIVPIPIEMTLGRTRNVRLQVVIQGTNVPVPEARMSASGQRAGSASFSAIADRQGKLTLKLPSGHYTLRGRPSRGSAESMCIQTNAELVIGDALEQTATFEFKPGCRIVLKAVDGKTGKPIPGVSFWFKDDRNRYLHPLTKPVYKEGRETNSRGEQRAILAPGDYRVGVDRRALPDGWQAQAADLNTGRAVKLKAGEETTAEFSLSESQ